MSTEIVKYTPMNLDELDQQERSIGFGSGNSQFYQWKDGRNVVRILPGTNGRQPFLQFWKHFVKGAENGKAWGGACPLKMAKQPCPVCKVAGKLSRGTEADRELANDMTARGRVIANLLDRSAPDMGPQVAEFGPAIYNQVKDIMKNLGEDPTHPTEGFDLIVEKSGKGLRTEYKVTPVRKNSALHDDARQMNDWLQSAADLGMYAVVQAEHEIAGKLAGTIIAHMLGGTPTPRAAQPPRASAAAAAVDVDSDDDLNY
jgi:hypothetical protein